MSLTRPKPVAYGLPEAECRVRLLSVLAAEQITCLGTGSFSALPDQGVPAGRTAPEACLREALHVLTKTHPAGIALSWFFEAGGDGEDAPLDALARGRCDEVLARARAAR
jgi:hypothetical protein